MLQYIEQVNSLLCFIDAFAQGLRRLPCCFREHNQVFFVHNLLNYAHLMPVHLAQMNALENDDPVTWEAKVIL